MAGCSAQAAREPRALVEAGNVGRHQNPPVITARFLDDDADRTATAPVPGIARQGGARR
jgi:hypothetical protein